MSTGSTNSSGAVTFAKRVAGTFGVRMASAGGSLLAGIIIARWLGTAGVGIVSSLSVIMLIAITLAGSGLPSAITFLIARDRSRSRSVLGNALLYGMMVGSLVAGGIFLLVLFHPELFGEVPLYLVKISLISVPFQTVSYFCLAVYLGLGRIRTYNLIDLTMQALVLLTVSITLIVVHLGLTELTIANVAANITICGLIVASAVKTSREYTGESADPLQVMREMLGHGARFFISIGASLVILRGDLLLVNYFSSVTDAGLYAVATQLSIFVQMFANVISTILFPRTASSPDQRGSVTCSVVRHSVPIIGLLCLLMVPAAFMIPLLYGPAFSGVPVLFLVLLPGVFLLGIETIQVQHFNGLGLPWQIPVYWIGTMVVCLGLDLILIPKYGTLGAAVVSSISYGLIFVLVARLFRSRTGRPLSETFILRRSDLQNVFRSRRQGLLNVSEESR